MAQHPQHHEHHQHRALGTTVVLEVGGLHWATEQAVVERVLCRASGRAGRESPLVALQQIFIQRLKGVDVIVMAEPSKPVLAIWSHAAKAAPLHQRLLTCRRNGTIRGTRFM